MLAHNQACRGSHVIDLRFCVETDLADVSFKSNSQAICLDRATQNSVLLRSVADSSRIEFASRRIQQSRFDHCSVDCLRSAAASFSLHDTYRKSDIDPRTNVVVLVYNFMFITAQHAFPLCPLFSFSCGNRICPSK